MTYSNEPHRVGPEDALGKEAHFRFRCDHVQVQVRDHVKWRPMEAQSDRKLSLLSSTANPYKPFLSQHSYMFRGLDYSILFSKYLLHTNPRIWNLHNYHKNLACL